MPLSSYGKPYTPLAGEVDNNLDMKTAVRDQVDHLEANDYFSYLARLMKTNPPTSDDAPMVAKMAKIGLVPGQDFDPSKLGAFDKEAIKAVPKLGQVKIMEYFKKSAEPINGWVLTKDVGQYGTDYLQRALVTAIGLGANRPKDAIYPTSEKDADGKEYDGTKNYVMHIEKGQLPPVDGFWSLTMYDANFFFVPNRINRYTLSSRNKFLTNSDGSVDLYLQADSPGKAKEANWLPTPNAKFVAMLRLYWPKKRRRRFLTARGNQQQSPGQNRGWSRRRGALLVDGALAGSRTFGNAKGPARQRNLRGIRISAGASAGCSTELPPDNRSVISRKRVQ